jgi:hypothetical protein
MRKVAWLSLVIGAGVVGAAVTWDGPIVWDDLEHLDHSRWLLSRYGLYAHPPFVARTVQWYGPLWELVMGLCTEWVFPFLRDPIWVRHAVTFALFPITIVAAYRLLGRVGYERSTRLLACACLFGVIRFGGHGLLNVKDFPFACAFLLASLGLWVLLREGQLPPLGSGFRRSTITAAVLVALVPFLVRPAIHFHFWGLFLFLVLYCALSLHLSRLARWLIPLSTILIGAVILFALFPPMWQRSWHVWIRPIRLFAAFPFEDEVRFFGTSYAVSALPRWYPLAWLPVLAEPVTSVVCLCGLAFFVYSLIQRLQSRTNPFELETRHGRVDLSFPLWLSLIVVASWCGVLIVKPTLYDEERHILFLFPPLFLLGALGLDRLPSRVKVSLVTLIVASSLASYASWGRYAYVYKSPLVGDTRASAFSGDYWGACLSEAVKALPAYVPKHAVVYADDYLGSAVLAARRYHESRFASIPDYGDYDWTKAYPSQPPWYAVVFNRAGTIEGVLANVTAGKFQVLWHSTMPPGDKACYLLEAAR